MASRSRCKTCASGSIQATNEALSLNVTVPSYRSIPPTFSAFARFPFHRYTLHPVPGLSCIRPRRHYYRFLISDLIGLPSLRFGVEVPYIRHGHFTHHSGTPFLIGPTIHFPPSHSSVIFKSHPASSAHCKKFARLHPSFAIWTIQPSSVSQCHRLDIHLISYMNTILGLALIVLLSPFLLFFFFVSHIH